MAGTVFSWHSGSRPGILPGIATAGWLNALVALLAGAAEGSVCTIGPCMSLVTLSPAWLSSPLTVSRLGRVPLLPAPQMIARLGREINHPDSIYYWAWKNGIPVFCPALTGALHVKRALLSSPAARGCWAVVLPAL